MRGRPRRSLTRTPDAGRTSWLPFESCPRLTMATVSRGPSSGSVQDGFEGLDLFFMAMPHRDYAATIRSRCPDDIDEPIAEVSVCQITALPVVETSILDRHRPAGENDARVVEVNAELLESLRPLAR